VVIVELLNFNVSLR